MSDYTELHDMLTEGEPEPRIFFDTAREKYQADKLDEADDRIYDLKALVGVLFAFVVAEGIAMACLLGGAV